MGSRGMRAVAIGIAGVMASVVLTGCGSDSRPTAKADEVPPSAKPGAGAREQGTMAVRAAYDRTAEARTARMTIRTKVTAQDEAIAANGDGAVDLVKGDSVMTLTANGKSIEQRVVDQILYQKVPGGKAPGGKPWIRIDLKKAAAQQGVNSKQIGDPAQSAAFAKAITDKNVTKVGTTTVGGVNTTQYEVTVDIARLPGGAALSKQLGPTLPMQVWLDDQGRIRRQQFDMTFKAQAPTGRPGNGSSPQQAKISTSIEFSDFGTKVDAAAPPAQQVADMTGKAVRDSRRQS
ncbi:hypothetical protein [Streptomyces sp. NPDC006368]|uniref:hypothetical protein n=1 Tax=Streptomyces sp. NPDC006368 TaxID=3156760 RepID=UPI0033A476F6